VKLSLFVLLLLISTTFIFYLVTARIMKLHIMNEVIKRAESLSRSIAATAGYSFLSQDILGLDNTVYKIKKSNPDIEYIAIVGTQMEIIVHSQIKKTGEKFQPAEGPVLKQSPDGTVIKEIFGPAGDFFEIANPIIFMNNNLGSVILSVNKSMLVEAQREAQKKIILLFAIILLLGITMSIFLSSFLTRPIQELSTGVAELKDGKRSRPLRIYSRDELGRLTEDFNEMTALITSQRDRLSKYAQDLEEAYVSTVRVLSAAIDARDHYTLGHSLRVAQISVLLGKEMGLNPEECEEIEIACLFHDVGKIKIPDSILLKKGNLSASERQEMMRHTEYGAEILSKAPSLLKYIPAVRFHHEWYDGTGYPDGLSGDKIPLIAAIISVVDVFDAMTSDRPHRKALSEEKALRQIISLSGKQFHPGLIEAFIRIVEKHKIPARPNILEKKS